MRFKILTEIGEHYRNEEGTEGVRRIALEGLEQRLKLAYERSDVAQEAVDTRQVANVAGGPGRVKALAAFHTQQQNKDSTLEKANTEVIRIRQWLHRQDASLTAEGKIIWPKSTRRVVYDRDLAAQNLTRVTVRNGILQTANGQPLDTRNMVTHFSGPGFAIYVMSVEGNLYVSSHSVGHRHHSSLLAGGMVSGAGEIKVTQGRVSWISNKSGHYQPDVFHLLQTLHSLWVQGVQLDFTIRCMTAAGGSTYANMTEFVIGQGFDDSTVESMQILHGYGHHLTPAFLVHNHLHWEPSTSGALLGGIYDTTQVPWRRLGYSEFAGKMQASGFMPKMVFASGLGR